MRLDRQTIRRLVLEEISRSRGPAKRSLASVLFEDMSRDDAVKAIKAGIVEPIENESGKAKVEKVVQFLNSAEGKDATVRELLKQGQKDGAPSDEALTVGPQEIPALNAAPSQSQIGLPNSVGFAFTTKGMNLALKPAMSGKIDAQSIIAAGSGKAGETFIVDGHHRWSSAIVVNPDVKITVSLIQQSDPFKALAISQVLIAGIVGAGKDLPSSTSEPDTNILTMGEAEIAEYCIDAAKKGKTLDDKGGVFLTDDVVAYCASIGYGGAAESDDKDTQIRKICEKIAANCKKVPQTGDTPPRAIMPQFDPRVGGPKPDAAIPVFQSGEVNFKEPIASESRRRSNDEIILERWQKMAGLIK